jgi:glycosyltransferase involved in cell wall biosynthesis
MLRNRPKISNRENLIFNIIVIGRLVSIKQPEKIINAFNLLNYNEITLTFVGDGFLKQKLMKENLDSIVFKGVLERESVYQELFKSDLFISMSLTEGMPMAVLEAMAAGLPVVLSDIISHREIVEGLSQVDLIPIDTDEVMLKNVLEKFIKMPKQNINKISCKNSNHILENFSINKMLFQYEQVYARIISKL